MNFNCDSWSISNNCFNYIRELLPENKTILELGSGCGTEHLSKYYKMYSIENQIEWVGKYESTYIHAPIRLYEESSWWNNDPFIAVEDIPSEIGDNFQKGWFDPDIVKSQLPKEYDLILVDGPNGTIGRGGFYKYLDYFNTDVPIIMDDVGREPERILMEKVSKKLNRDYIILDDKVTGVIL